MLGSKHLQVAVDHRSSAGRRPNNEDFAGAVTPEGDVLDAKGVLCAVADGVGGHARGEDASHHAVRSLLVDYYATPDTWSSEDALQTVIAAINRWLLGESRRTRERAGMATTLTVLLLRGRRYTLAHVGDSRAYLLRQGQLTQLTEDHTWPHPEFNNVLKRAVGLDESVQIDFSEGDLEPNDQFLLVTDGVWGTLSDDTLAQALSSGSSLEDLLERALKAGSEDNVTALSVKVVQLGGETLRDQLLANQARPVPPKLQVGDMIDGMRVDEVIHRSRVTLLYRVTRPGENGPEQLVMKTLRFDAADDESIRALIYEEWLTRRVIGPGFPEIRQHPGRQFLYYLMEWCEGETLKQRLERGHRFDPVEVTDLGIHLLKGIAKLHRLKIIHRDIKPDNLHRSKSGQLRILDLGVAASDNESFKEINNPGTPSYMAPELFHGGRAHESSDLYAVAVTLYQLLTRRYPFGEIEPFQKPVFTVATPPTRYRPEIPEWLENILLKGLAVRPEERFETAEEFLLALEYGAHRPLASPRKIPLLQRRPNLVMGTLLLISLFINVVLLIRLALH